MASTETKILTHIPLQGDLSVTIDGSPSNDVATITDNVNVSFISTIHATTTKPDILEVEISLPVKLGFSWSGIYTRADFSLYNRTNGTEYTFLDVEPSRSYANPTFLKLVDNIDNSAFVISLVRSQDNSRAFKWVFGFVPTYNISSTTITFDYVAFGYDAINLLGVMATFLYTTDNDPLNNYIYPKSENGEIFEYRNLSVAYNQGDVKNITCMKLDESEHKMTFNLDTITVKNCSFWYVIDSTWEQFVLNDGNEYFGGVQNDGTSIDLNGTEFQFVMSGTECTFTISNKVKYITDIRFYSDENFELGAYPKKPVFGFHQLAHNASIGIAGNKLTNGLMVFDHNTNEPADLLVKNLTVDTITTNSIQFDRSGKRGITAVDGIYDPETEITNEQMNLSIRDEVLVKLSRNDIKDGFGSFDEKVEIFAPLIALENASFGNRIDFVKSANHFASIKGGFVTGTGAFVAIGASDDGGFSFDDETIVDGLEINPPTMKVFENSVEINKPVILSNEIRMLNAASNQHNIKAVGNSLILEAIGDNSYGSIGFNVPRLGQLKTFETFHIRNNEVIISGTCTFRNTVPNVVDDVNVLVTSSFFVSTVSNGLNLNNLMTITSGGNVGIGTETPSEKLEVNGNAYVQKRLDLFRDGTYYASLRGGFIQNQGAYVAIGASDNSGTSAVDTVRVFQNQVEIIKPMKISVGDDSYTEYGPNLKWGGKLFVGACRSRLEAAFNTEAQVIVTSGALHLDGATGRGVYLNFHNKSSYVNMTGKVTMENDLDVIGTIRQSGSAVTSDRRIKKDIDDIDDEYALSILRALKPKTYKYKDVTKGDATIIGYIAQDVKEILPQAVDLFDGEIPNIMMKADLVKLDDGTMQLTFEKDIPDIIKDDIIKIESSTRVTVISSTQRTLIIEYEESIKDKLYVSVFGQVVKDFHYLKKDAIFAMTTAACQQIDRELQTEKTKVANQQSVITGLKAENADMKAQIAALYNHLGIYPASHSEEMSGNVENM